MLLQNVQFPLQGWQLLLVAVLTMPYPEMQVIQKSLALHTEQLVIHGTQSPAETVYPAAHESHLPLPATAQERQFGAQGLHVPTPFRSGPLVVSVHLVQRASVVHCEQLALMLHNTQLNCKPMGVP